MAGRKKTIPDDAEGTTVYLTPEEHVVLRVILARRKKKRESRASQNEILVDGLWYILTEIEKIPREAIAALVDVGIKDGLPSNVTEFPAKKQ